MSSKKFPKAQLHRKYNGRCAYCGKGLKIQDTTIDHVKPQARNGANNKYNYMPACKMCNNAKADMTLQEWRRHIQKHGAHFTLINDHYFYFETKRAKRI